MNAHPEIIPSLAQSRRIVNEAFAEEKPALKPLPLVPIVRY
jgi:hypothetical protein